MPRVRLQRSAWFLLNWGTFQSLLIFFLCHGSSVAEPKPEKSSYWYSHDYPNPRTEPERCGRSPGHLSWLCDPDDFISEADAMKLDELINSSYSDTRCRCYSCITNSHGYLIMVALMEAMYRDQTQINGTQSTQKLFSDAKKFAGDLMHQWSEKSTCKEYIFILFSRNDNVLYTLAEENANKILNNTMIMKVNGYIHRYFSYKEGMAKGLHKMITYYKDILLQRFKDPGPLQSLVPNQVQYSEIQETKSKANSGKYKQFSLLFSICFQIVHVFS